MLKLPIEYLRHIIEETEFILKETNNISKDNFYLNPVLKRAVVRSLEIIGEASAKLSEDFLSEHPEIDWRGLKSMRNLLIHEYAYVDAEEVWKACQTDIPNLKTKLATLKGKI